MQKDIWNKIDFLFLNFGAFILFYLIFNYILLIMLLQLSQSSLPTLPPLHQAPPTLSGNPHTIAHVHGSCV